MSTQKTKKQNPIDNKINESYKQLLEILNRFCALDRGKQTGRACHYKAKVRLGEVARQVLWQLAITVNYIPARRAGLN